MRKEEAYIEFILNELGKGNVSFTKVFELNRTKFNLARPTFSKYWKLANEAYTEQRRAVKSAKLKQTIEEEIKAVTKQILTKNEALEIITNIAKGNARRVKIGDKEQVLIPTENERLKAIEIGAKIEGWNAPQKTDLTTNGKELTTNIIVHDNEMAKRLKEMEEQSLNEMK